MSEIKRNKHIVLTSHPSGGAKPMPIHWGAANARERGPVIGTLTDSNKRNVSFDNTETTNQQCYFDASRIPSCDYGSAGPTGTPRANV